MRVNANPGTGKTSLLAHKFVDLTKKGVRPDQILCLTFTHKAKTELERRILDLLNEENVKIDRSRLRVFTFHSYALDNLDQNEIISDNLLRFSIFEHLKGEDFFDYGDEYLLYTIIPKMHNLVKYLKNFGITPEDVDIEKSKKLLEEYNAYSKNEMELLAENFLNAFRHYEAAKRKKGCVDYSDLLIQFLKLKKTPKFEYVFVDELQDVNDLEADIALRSCKNFIAVGDKKQAIFGFQGGSISNFEKFRNSTHEVLSENFRSTDEILNYAKEHFVSKTKEKSHKEDLKNLRSSKGLSGPKPEICEVNENKYATACELAKKLRGETAIITRTNRQIAEISKELKARNMNFSSTYSSESGDAKRHVINFLKGVLSSEVQDVKNAMFTPFFPCTLQKAFATAEDKHLTMEKLTSTIPALRRLRASVRTVEDVNQLFKEKILPVCIAYGREHVYAALSVQAAYNEALKVLQNKDFQSMALYLLSSAAMSEDTSEDEEIILTTVHKAKGREFENVIYVPSKTRDQSNFHDKIVEAILKTKGISAKEELEEESLRIDFVAFTRAKKKLIVVPDKVQDYLNDFSNLKELDAKTAKTWTDDHENQKKAYNLFVNGQMEEAKQLLESETFWIKDFIRNYFKRLDHVSFSSLPKDAYGYFVEKMLNTTSRSKETTLGLEVHEIAEKLLKHDAEQTVDSLEVHEIAEKLLKGKKVKPEEKLKPYVENTRALIDEIKRSYPSAEPEKKISVSLRKLGFDSELAFEGKIDAVFKNESGERLIVDWKTSKKEDSSHKQQLSIYKKALSATEEIPEEKIEAAVGYVGLKSLVSGSQTSKKLDSKQPSSRSFKTVSKKIKKLLSWHENPELFFQEFLDQRIDDFLWRSAAEQLRKEKRDISEKS